MDHRLSQAAKTKASTVGLSNKIAPLYPQELWEDGCSKHLAATTRRSDSTRSLPVHTQTLNWNRLLHQSQQQWKWDLKQLERQQKPQCQALWLKQSQGGSNQPLLWRTGPRKSSVSPRRVLSGSGTGTLRILVVEHLLQTHCPWCGQTTDATSHVVFQATLWTHRTFTVHVLMVPTCVV